MRGDFIGERVRMLGIDDADKQQPIFLIGPEGKLSINSRWKEPVSKLCKEVKKRLGDNASANVWPYRIEGSRCLAFDAEGDDGEVYVTICETGFCKLPTFDASGTEKSFVCDVVDGVDALYLVLQLLNTLDLETFPYFVFDQHRSKKEV